MKLRLRFGRQQGFTLIETVAALGVFSLITLGIAPLMISSIRASAISRSQTVLKNAAVEAVERARGLPFFISYSAQNAKVDLLDLYFPTHSPSGTFTTTCTATTTDPACPQGIPSGATLTFTASFVTPVAGTNPQTFAVVAPSPTYRYDSTTGLDYPPSRLLRINVAATGTVVGSDTFNLATLIGDRKFAPPTTTSAGAPSPGPTPSAGPSPSPSPAAPPPPPVVGANAFGTLDYLLKADTSFFKSGDQSDLSVTLGQSDARMETGNVIAADQSTRMGSAHLIRPGTDTEIATDMAVREGAALVKHAPPSQAWAEQKVTNGKLRHPDINADVAFLGDTYAGVLTTLIFGEPFAYGLFEADTKSNSLEEAWVTNQVAAGGFLRLNTSKPYLYITEQTNKESMSDDMWGGASALATTLTSPWGRKAEGIARGELWDVAIAPTTFISGKGVVVYLSNFTFRVECKATANGTTAVATATWSGTLNYWRDTTNDGSLNGSYASVALSGALGTDPLQAIKAANPIVYDAPAAQVDTHLFEDTVSGKPGYLRDWASLADVSGTTSADGRTTSAAIPGAIRIDTAPTSTSVDSSNFNISIAKLSCGSQDWR